MFLTDNWKKINIDPVCFGTKNDDFGSFEIQEAGKVYTFKLVHHVILTSNQQSGDVHTQIWDVVYY